MQRLTNPELYSQIIEDKNHWFVAAVVVGDSGVLITQRGERILFGDGAEQTAISVFKSSPDYGFPEENIRSITTRTQMFSNAPEIGGAIASEIDIVLENIVADIPPMARIAVYVKACTETLESEWIPQGVFFVDTRERTDSDDEIDLLTIHGFDAMLKFEQEFMDDDGRWPFGTDPETGEQTDALDTDAVLFMASHIGVLVDNRTWDIMTDRFQIPYPIGYTYREVLGYIAGAYAGCFVITDKGDLRLVSLTDLPFVSNYLVDSIGDIITFGQNAETIKTGASIQFTANQYSVVCSDGLSATISAMQWAKSDFGKNGGTYEFVYTVNGWSCVNGSVDLEDYGITVTGSPLTGSTVTVYYLDIGSTLNDGLILQLPYRSSGYSGASISYSGANTAEAEILDADWSLIVESGIIYGGSWDVNEGVLESTYDEDGNLLEEPETYQLVSRTYIPLNGTNKMWTSSGTINLTCVTSNAVRILV